MESALGHLREFNPKCSDWTVFKPRILNYFIANEIEDEVKKRAILLNCLNEEAYKLIRNLSLPDTPETLAINDLLEILDTHFKSTVSVYAKRLKLFSAIKSESESPNEWIAKIRELALDCDYSASELKFILREKFITGFNSGPVRDRLFEEKTLTIEKAIKIANAKAAVQNNEDIQIKTEPGLHTLRAIGKRSNEKAGMKIASVSGSPSTSSGNPRKQSPKTPSCTVCGWKNHVRAQCRYRECVCDKCGKKGHLASICFAKLNLANKSKKNIVQTNMLDSNNCNQQIFTTNLDEDVNLEPILLKIKINNKEILGQLDTGASKTVISESIYKQYFSELELIPTQTIFFSWIKTKFVTLGKFFADISFDNKINNIEIYVIKDGGMLLLGRDFFNKFNLSVNGLHQLNSENIVEYFKNKYHNLFSEGLGHFKYGVVSLNLKDKDVRPKFLRARPLPHAIKEKVEFELSRLEKLGVISKIDYSPWGTPIVPVLKSNNSIRICGDYKVTVNPHLEIDQYPLPRIEETFSKLNGGIHFTKLDLSRAYNQIELTEDSKRMLTITTHKGLYKFNRLPFGIAAAPAKFQKIMNSLFQGIEGVTVYLDDILITGRNQKEHFDKIEKVFQILQNAGLKLELNKCKFFQDKITYLGYDIDKHGLHTNEKKINAIKNATKPENNKQLKSFLGLVNYYGKFVKNLSTILHPLYNLLKEKTEWIWNTDCDVAFNNIKDYLTSAEVLVHFNPNLPLRLVTDASDYGVGAILQHELPDGSNKPIAYASRTLSDAEKKYSQIEKEALSIIFGLNKFNEYLYGTKFTLVTDHKPLITIFNPSRGIPQFSANRLRRWATILSNYQYKIEFVKSDENIADILSRLPSQNEKNENKDFKVNYVKYFENNEDFPLDVKKIQEETLKDDELQKVIHFTKNGWNNKIDNLKPYYKLKNELSLEDNCLLWNNRIVIPKNLRERLICELHSSHMGIGKMKSIARSYFWWPYLDKDIEQKAKSCNICLKNSNSPKLSKLNPWPFILKPWSRLHIDYMGPIKNYHFLIIIDSTTKWIEAFQTKNLTSEFTINTLRNTFARFGLPDTIVSDNATAFTSNKFQNFLKLNGISHITSPPYNPSSNGAAENAVKTIKQALKKKLGENQNADINVILNNFLLDYRTSMHSTTQESPSFLMFGRKIKTRFDLLKPKNTISNEIKEKVKVNQEKQVRLYKGNRKQSFLKGDGVVVRDYRTVNKQSWIKGIIHKRIGTGTYLVEIPELNIIWKRHLNQIKKLHV